MKLAFRRSTGQLIPDFQSRATEAALRRNAELRGIPRADVVIREVSAEEWRRLERAAYQAARDQAELDRQQLDARARAVQVKLNLDDQEVEALRRLVAGPVPPAR